MLDLCSDEELEVGCLVLACMREASQINVRLGEWVEMKLWWCQALQLTVRRCVYSLVWRPAIAPGYQCIADAVACVCNSFCWCYLLLHRTLLSRLHTQDHCVTGRVSLHVHSMLVGLLQAIYNILHGASPFSPVVKSIVREDEPPLLQLRGRTSIMHKVRAT